MTTETTLALLLALIAGTVILWKGYTLLTTQPPRFAFIEPDTNTLFCPEGLSLPLMGDTHYCKGRPFICTRNLRQFTNTHDNNCCYLCLDRNEENCCTGDDTNASHF